MVCGVLAHKGKRERLKPLFFLCSTPSMRHNLRSGFELRRKPGKSEKRLTFGGQFRPRSLPTAFEGEDTAAVLMKTQSLG
jgi:hypothetical protein